MLMSLVDRKLFGGKLRQIRLERGMTQERLAEKAGIHPTYVGGIERGERNVGLDNILKIARALDVPPTRLFEDFEEHRGHHEEHQEIR